MKRLCVVILNYRRAGLTIDCLESLAPEMDGRADRHVVVIDQASGDGSAEAIARSIEAGGWKDWVTFIASPVNLGFAGGNNLGVRTIGAENYLFLNSDTRLARAAGEGAPNAVGAIERMLQALAEHPEVGAVGPRLEDQQGNAQTSCFRYRTPLTEFLDAAGTGPLDRLFARHLVPMGIYAEPMEPQWLSFACIMIRRAVIEQVGPMDEQYFMYFEDIDYSRRIRKAGWRILHEPRARVIHLRGGSSSVKAAMRARARVPKYYYESRSRYYAKFYGGPPGLWLTNLLWLLGRCFAWVRETLGSKEPDVCDLEGRDNWTNWLRPLRPPSPQKGGEL